ncbi:MAG: 2-oxo acid dehydrogenase subunit E2 [Venatoribacter sp.]
MTQLTLPDMGSDSKADVIEILIKEGDDLALEQSTLVLESEKATIEVPASAAGKVTKLLVKVGDQLGSFDAYAELEASAVAPNTSKSKVPNKQSTANASTEFAAPVESPVAKPVGEPEVVQATQTWVQPNADLDDEAELYAGPAVRRLARELGVALKDVKATGMRNRIQKEDVQSFVKQQLKQGGSSGLAIPKTPEIDFSQFGPIREERLNNVKKATAKAMTLANLTVPQVTQFDQIDITELEQFRQSLAERGEKVSLVAFVLKALACCMRDFPTFNSSLSQDGESLIIKEYLHVGVAVDTPKGLLVPVIRDVLQKSVLKLNQNLQEMAEQARQGNLSLADMQGGCFTISSLGGIGGTAFTPIVTPPQVAILGLSKAEMQPKWNGESFIARLILPISLSYDHRVIDGAEAARFSRRLAYYLQDLRNIIM